MKFESVLKYASFDTSHNYILKNHIINNFDITFKIPIESEFKQKSLHPNIHIEALYTILFLAGTPVMSVEHNYNNIVSREPVLEK